MGSAMKWGVKKGVGALPLCICLLSSLPLWRTTQDANVRANTTKRSQIEQKEKVGRELKSK